jgi:GNAT superfamily N-acetyltransferase
MDVSRSPIIFYPKIMSAVPDTTPTLNPQPSAHIRLASPSDAPSIARIFRESFDEFRPRYTSEGLVATTPDEHSIGSRMNEGPTWVAVSDDAIVGTVSAVHRPDSTLYIRGMAVIPVARGNNIGRMLLATIERYALEHGCHRLKLCTTPFLATAIRLYERFGFRFIAEGPNDLFGTPILNMAKPLGGESSLFEKHRKEQLCRKIMDTLRTATQACA